MRTKDKGRASVKTVRSKRTKNPVTVLRNRTAKIPAVRLNPTKNPKAATLKVLLTAKLPEKIILNPDPVKAKRTPAAKKLTADLPVRKAISKDKVKIQTTCKQISSGQKNEKSNRYDDGFAV